MDGNSNSKKDANSNSNSKSSRALGGAGRVRAVEAVLAMLGAHARELPAYALSA